MGISTSKYRVRIGLFIIALQLAFIFFYFFGQDAYLWCERWYQMSNITSSNLEARNHALKYLSDPGLSSYHQIRVIRLAVGRMDGADDQNFMQIMDVIDKAQYWFYGEIPVRQHWRWVQLLAKDKEAGNRIRAARECTLPQLSSRSPEFVSILSPLLQDVDASVRLRTLYAAATLCSPLVDEIYGRISPVPINEAVKSSRLMILHQAVMSHDPVIARHAWIFLGLLGNEIPAPLVNDASAKTTDVIEAKLWALAKCSNLQAVHPAEQTASANSNVTPEADTTVDAQAAAVYAMAQKNSSQSREVLMTQLRKGLDDISSQNQLLLWRTILALGKDETPEKRRELAGILRDFKSRGLAQGTQKIMLPILCAAMYADPLGFWGHADFDEPTLIVMRQAQCEGLALIHEYRAPDVGGSLLLQLAQFSASEKPNVQRILPLLYSEQSTMRDIACVAASQRLQRPELELLVDDLLKEDQDNPKISGAILSGLSGFSGGHVLTNMNQFELESRKKGYQLGQHDEMMSTIMQLGLAMQKYPLHVGKGPSDWSGFGVDLLTNMDCPRSTLVLGLMHQGNFKGFDSVLAPWQDRPMDLQKLLVEDRWWLVLKNYLPKDAPEIWLWADEDLQRFQIDVLRDWYVLNRHRLMKNKS